MATVVVMPQLGNSVESCLITSWLVEPGASVSEATVVCEVETDKASMEIPSGTDGTVLAVLWAEGDDVPVKQPLLVIGEEGEDPAPALEAAGWEGGHPTGAASEAPHSAAVPEPRASDTSPTRAEAGGASSPRARSLADANSLNIDTVAEGSGPHGRVIERDVRAAMADATRGAARAGAHGAEVSGTGLGGRVTVGDLAHQAQPAAQAGELQTGDYPGPSTSTPLKGIRRTIAERMMNSLATSAQLTYTTTASAAGLLELRKKLKTAPGELGLGGVTIGDLVGFAAVRTAVRHPSHNAHLSDGTLTSYEQVHLGFACDTPRGLLVPTVRNASGMGLREFSAVSKELARQAIAGEIGPDLLTGATFTVSNLGGLGIESFTPLLNVPQVAILGVDAIFPRAVVLPDGSFGVEQRIGFSLTADHRVIDGADAARFLQDLVARVEHIDVTVLG